MKRIKPLHLIAGSVLLISLLCSPQAKALGPYAPAQPCLLPLEASAADARQATVTAAPNPVFNGNMITFSARCFNPAQEQVSEAGYYVGLDDTDLLKVDCDEPVAQLSQAVSVTFDVKTKQPVYAAGVFKAFVVLGGQEIDSTELPFNTRPPLPPPQISIQDGAKIALDDLSLTWKAVAGAAFYGIRLEDITKTTPRFLLGKNTDDPSTAYLWLQGNMNAVDAGANKFKLVSGHKYRFTVAASYDGREAYGGSVEFTAVSQASAKKAAPKAATGAYSKSGNDKYTLYGAADGAGEPISDYGFYVGTDQKALQRMPAGNAAQFSDGAYSMTVSIKNANGSAIYFRAYAVGANGVQSLGGVRKIDPNQPDPFAPTQQQAMISKAYVSKLKAIDPGWAFTYVKKQPYDDSDYGIQLLNNWEKDHILKGFAFPGNAININKGAQRQYSEAAALLNSTRVKLVYNDGSVSVFTLKDLVKTASCFNARFIAPTTEDGGSNPLLPDAWKWNLSLHSWGTSVDIDAGVPVNGQEGLHFLTIRNGAARLSRVPCADADGSIVLYYNGYPQRGRLVPDDVLNFILYEFAFKEAGFYWGAYFGNGRTDPMHFSLIEAPARKDIPMEEAKKLP